MSERLINYTVGVDMIFTLKDDKKVRGGKVRMVESLMFNSGGLSEFKFTNAHLVEALDELEVANDLRMVCITFFLIYIYIYIYPIMTRIYCAFANIYT